MSKPDNKYPLYYYNEADPMVFGERAVKVIDQWSAIEIVILFNGSVKITKHEGVSFEDRPLNGSEEDYLKVLRRACEITTVLYAAHSGKSFQEEITNHQVTDLYLIPREEDFCFSEPIEGESALEVLDKKMEFAKLDFRYKLGLDFIVLGLMGLILLLVVPLYKPTQSDNEQTIIMLSDLDQDIHHLEELIKSNNE